MRRLSNGEVFVGGKYRLMNEIGLQCNSINVVLFPKRFGTKLNLSVFLLIVGLSSVLCFCGLGNRTLWQDEGETAVLAQRVLKDGIPKALSGEHNLVYWDDQSIPQYDENYRWICHPWGQFYLVAASFELFGQTTFAARFPFALCGVLTVALLYVFAWRHWHSLAVAALSALLLATSTAFVLHCRQCRYYGLSALTCLAIVVVFVELMKRPCRLWSSMFGLALAAQFYSDFGTLTVILPGLAVSLWPMGARKKEMAAAAKGFVLAALLMVPGLLLHWNRLMTAGKGGHKFLRVMPINIYYFDNWFIPLVFVLPAGILFVRRLVKSRERLSEQDRIIITCVLITVSAVVGMGWAEPVSNLRYIVPQISFAKLLLALIILRCYKILLREHLPSLAAKAVVLVNILILMFSNVFGLVTHYLVHPKARYKVLDFCSKTTPSVRTELAGLIYEMTHNFICPDRVAVNVVNDLAKAGETVAIDYSGLVIMFYRPDLRVYYGYTLSNLQMLPDLFIKCQTPGDINEEVLRKYSYVCLTFDVPAAFFAANIPEPGKHLFATSENRVSFKIYLRADHKDRLLRLPQTAKELEVLWCR